MRLVPTLCLLFVGVALGEKSRHPKLFFVSSSSTSTLSTTTLCYSTSTTFTTTACSGKKKRAIYTAPVEETLDLEDYIKPQPIVSERDDDNLDNDAEAVNEKLIESGKTEYEREGKFLLYWKTTTSTSTSTSYTATTTLGALGCTPSGFTVSQ